jgi:hypothetical protein
MLVEAAWAVRGAATLALDLGGAVPADGGFFSSGAKLPSATAS